MNTLIIDCSAGMSLILLKGDETFSYVDENQKKHTDELLLKLDELLAKANLKLKQIDNLCVCVGPGSFTGIRVAISIVKGIAVSGDFKIFVLSNFDIYESLEYGVLVLEGFSNNVYARFFDHDVFVDKCVSIEELHSEIINKNKDYKIIVQNEKTQNLLKKAEIQSQIAKKDIIFAFYNSIIKNKNISIEQISPIYLRASQAEIERLKKGK